MIKKILVVLDTSKSSQRVRDLAINIALNTKAKLTGIGILDTPSITTPRIEPLGGVAYNIDHEDEIILKSHQHVLKLMRIFKKRGAGHDIAIKTMETKGNPIDQIQLLSHEHNIIIISRKTNFHFEAEDETDETVKKVARDNPRPIIVVPPFKKLGEDILIAYDGSLAATRSLHMFLLLGIWEGHKIHIISIDEDFEKAENIGMQASKMCNIYNIKPKLYCIKSNKNPAELIIEKAKEIKAWMVVIGAFKHNKLHDVLFDSSTSILMKNSEVPLFIHR
ncbi:MAG: universal stress protein [Bacteroidetes bacterium]|nr:universal stress protein [Bacteroidota bacterium]